MAAAQCGVQGDAERAFILSMQRLGRIQVHATPCAGMRECGDGDIDPSCHWDNRGRYLCLL